MSQRASAFPSADAADPAAWDRWVRHLDPLATAAGRIVVFAPHPDDETFGCGGLIAGAAARGGAVEVVTVTDGSRSHPGSQGLAELRRREQAAAVAALGCARPPRWLGLPDGGLADHEAALAATISEASAGADLIVAPWPHDRHPDHEVVGRLALRAAAAAAVPVLAYPVWLWRWGTPADAGPGRFLRLDLDPGARRAKRAAVACYPSQTTELLGDTVVDAAMLDRFDRPFEVFGG